MKTFNNLKTGDCFYDVCGSRLFRNRITEIHRGVDYITFFWVDQKGVMATTSIPICLMDQCLYNRIGSTIVSVSDKNMILEALKLNNEKF